MSDNPLVIANLSHDDIQRLITGLEARVEQAEADLQAAQTVNDVLKHNNERLLAERKQAEADLAAARDAHNRVVAALAECQQERDAARAEVLKWSQDLYAANARADLLAGHADAAKATVERLLARVEQAERDYNAQAVERFAEQSVAGHTIDQLEAEIPALREVAGEANTLLITVGQRHADFCRDLTAALGYTTGGPTAPDELLAEVAELRQMCNEVIDQRDAARAEAARLREALSSIATHPHISYDHPENAGGSYGTGCADGHRCAAHIAKAALEATHD